VTIHLTAAFADVLQERERQISSEGFSLEHDDRHAGGELAKASACLALEALSRRDFFAGAALSAVRVAISSIWPWAPDWWRPKDYRRDLVRAAALLVAEIERVDRLDGRSGNPLEKISDQELELELARRGLTPILRRTDSPRNTLSGNRRNAEAMAKHGN
jgi:hypothetical protein